MAIPQDVRDAVRLLRREPGFACTSILMLALGLGAATAMFSIVNGVLLQPLPYESAGEVVAVRPGDATGGHPAVSLPDFQAIRDRNRTFDGVAAYFHRATNLTGTDQPEQLQALVVSSMFFEVLRAQPALGRVFGPADEEWGNHRVVILSDGMWRGEFGADPAVLGRTITLDNDAYTVVGVLRSDFWFLDGDTRLITPLAFAPDDGRRTRANHFLTIVGRLKGGVSPANATSDLAAVNAVLTAESESNRGLSFGVMPLQEVVVSNVRTAVTVLMASASILLLIGCVNLAGLGLARAVARRKDAAIRLALGATPAQLTSHLLVEAGALAGLGGGLGALFAYLATRSIQAVSPAVLPRASQVHIDATVLLVTAGLTTLSTFGVGVFPAWRNTRNDVSTALNESGRGSGASRAAARTRATLVVLQAAFAVVLLVAGGLMVRSLFRLTHLELGFDPNHILTFSVSLPASGYLDTSVRPRYAPEATQKADVYLRAAIERIRELPGVRAVGAASLLPAVGMGWDKVVTLWDRPLPSTVRDLPQFEYRPVAGDYFAAMGIPLLRGRLFDDRDTLRSALVVIVNEEFVRRHYGARDTEALGKQVSLNPPRKLLPPAAISEDSPTDPPRFTIVGVVADARNASVYQPADPMIYCPYSQGAEDQLTMSFAVRTVAEPASVAPAVRQAMAAIDRNQPLANINTMDAALSTSLGRPQVEARALATFAVLALALAAFGVYAFMAFAVAQHTREIALRIALGGAPLQLAVGVIGRSIALTAAGILLGSGAAIVVSRLMRSMLFGVDALDPLVFVAVGAVLVLSAALAALVPALRAARVDPVVALR